jgi:hypothetical protein
MKRIAVATLVVAVFVGLWNFRVAAHDANLPFAVGDSIQMGGVSICTVQAIRGTFIRCQGGLPSDENWWNLMAIEHVRIVRR